MNQKLPSPLLDRAAVTSDDRFMQPLNLQTPFDLTFQTGRYFEGGAGSLGFAYLLLVPLALLAVPAMRRPPAGAAAVAAVVSFSHRDEVAPQRRCYLYPALPLLLLPLAALFGWLRPGVVRRALIALSVACVLMNTWFLSASNSYHGDFYERSPLSAAMRQAYLHRHAPLREIAHYMNREHPGNRC